MNLFQSPEWEQFKLATGWQKSYRIDGILVLQKNLPFGRSMLYSPMVELNNEERITNNGFVDQIKKIGAENRAIFYRLESGSPIIHNSSFIILQNFIKGFEKMQPEHTLILDISIPDDEILAQMKPKGRYNIKVAEKNGIEIIKDGSIDNFYKLYSGMAKRHKITFRNKQYFQNLFDILKQKDYCKVFTAHHKNTPIASVIISFYDNRATYLFGGSSDEYKNMMAPYLLQWTAIREAKQRGCTEYDFFGIAPADQPNHPWRGVTDFKKKFGGKEVELLGSWDIVLRPIEYQIFKIAERLRRGSH